MHSAQSELIKASCRVVDVIWLTLRKFALQTAQSMAGPEGTTLRQGDEVKVKGIRSTRGV